MRMYEEELAHLKLAVGLPSYDGRAVYAEPLMYLARQVPHAVPIQVSSSLLALTFNMTLCAALKMRQTGEATHFLMLHDDIAPCGREWFMDLWQAYRDSTAQLIAAVVPVKDERGFTSTACESFPWGGKPRRYTMTEVMKMPAETFSEPGILLNTGCMLFDLREPWVDKCHFEVKDSIQWVNGEPCPQSASEDWNFTRQARENGCSRIYATRAVKLVHFGRQMFPNYQAWGKPHDDGSA